MKDRLTATISNIEPATMRRIVAALNVNNRPASKGAEPGSITILGYNGATNDHTIRATTRNLIARAKDAALGARIARSVAEEEGR